MKYSIVKVALLSTFVSITQINAMQPVQFLPWVKKTHTSAKTYTDPSLFWVKIPTKPIVYVNGGSSNIPSQCKDDGIIYLTHGDDGYGGYICGTKKSPDKKSPAWIKDKSDHIRKIGKKYY